MPTIFNGVPWYDQHQQVVNAVGGCLIQESGKFYLFGEYRQAESTEFAGFSRYVSTDLENWTFTGLALPVQPSGLLEPNRIGDRVKVVRAQTGQYIMLMHTDDERTFDPVVAYAMADRLTDTFTFKGPLLFNNQSIRMWHIGSFTDDDGTNYLLTHEGDIYRLAADGTTAEAKIISNIAPGTEAPAMFRFHDHYFLLASQKTSWEHNDNVYFSADQLTGPWTAHGPFCPPGTLTYNSQTADVALLPTAKGTVPLYLGDRHTYPHLENSTHVWLPLSVHENTLSVPHYWPAWDWYQQREQPLTLTPLAWTGQTNDARMTLKFHGTGITMTGQTGTHGGFAKITLRDEAGQVKTQVYTDFYSLLHEDAPCYRSPTEPLGHYELTIEALGAHGDWYDKARRRYGSNGNRVTITGYHIDHPTNKHPKAVITYHASKQPFALNKIGFNWAQSAVARPEGSGDYQWLQSDIGEGELTIGDQQINLGPGQGILINLNTSYAYHPVTSLWQTSYLSFSGTILDDLIPGLQTANSLFFPVLGTEVLGFIHKHTRYQQTHRYQDDQNAAIVQNFLTKLKPYTVRLKADANKQALAEQTLNLLQQHFQEDLTNEHLAEMTNYSVQYMLQTFHDLYQTTPRRLLTIYRVIQAKQLLIERPDLPLSQIARQSGFHSETYMIRAFKRQEHLTPGEFRTIAHQLRS
ncbi:MULTISPECIES: helix-turn-helix domain-containing protein [Lacticaseibacillus]|uniref:helix-turn-helix domain-containing protein n=1 Tax=Lacticaseibacillus TaxID=2759736 RepID=UPI00063D94B3|nr:MULTISPECIES: helix-turn-helix domain-containing protein [Lacticaseibacillus]KLI75544.1 glycoside hydrolase family 43 [Lacticaseibacillus casei]